MRRRCPRHTCSHPHIHRVVVLAHSQGTIIAANVLQRLTQLYRGEAPPPGSSRYGLSLLTRDQMAKLEFYAFANCATRMQDVGPHECIPWIESFGNERDIVARLGMLAPDNHYLRPIVVGQVRGQRHGGEGGPHPFELMDNGGRSRRSSRPTEVVRLHQWWDASRVGHPSGGLRRHGSVTPRVTAGSRR